MNEIEKSAASADEVTIKLTATMRDQLDFLAKNWKQSVDEAAFELFKDELEVQVGMIREPYSRKYFYR